MILKITQKDIDNYEKHFETLADYPLYASTCGIGRMTGVLLSKLSQYDYKDMPMEITIKPLKTRKAKNESLETGKGNTTKTLL